MPLHPPVPVPERILAFGPGGSGKTFNWIDIAKISAATNSPATFYVLDTDFSVERMVLKYPTLSNIKLYFGYDWNDYTNFLSTVLTEAGPGDWVVVDFMGSAWEVVQSHFIHEVFHKDTASYFLQARKELKKGSSSLSALEGWTDWNVINALYREWANPLLFKGRYHLYATAKSDGLSSDRKPTEDASTRQIYLPYGVKPRGQKDLTYQFHTVLITGRDGAGNRTFTTVKDREREEVAGKLVNSFTIDYLKAIGGWELA